MKRFGAVLDGGGVILALMSVVVLAACGSHVGHRKGAKAAVDAAVGAESAVGADGPIEARSPLAQPASALRLQLVTAGSDRAYPGEELVKVEKVAWEYEIEFRTLIRISAPLFFAWGENVLASPIRDVRYEYRVQDLDGGFIGELDRKLASFDSASRRWFIPLSKLFQGKESRINPTHLQILTVDLLLADGTRQEIRIRFRAVGVVPEIRPVALVVSRLPADPSALALAARSGWVIARERYVNPTDRALLLAWGVDSARFRLKMTHEFSYHLGRVHEPPAGPFFRRTRSEVELRIAQVRVRLSNREPRVIPVVDLPSRIELAGGESAEVEWLAVPVDEGKRCSLPGPTERVFRWTESGVCPGSRGEGECDRPHRATVTDTARLVGAELEGQLTRSVHVSEAWVVLPETAVKDRSELSFRQHAGFLQRGDEDLFSCNGWL